MKDVDDMDEVSEPNEIGGAAAVSRMIEQLADLAATLYRERARLTPEQRKRVEDATARIRGVLLRVRQNGVAS